MAHELTDAIGRHLMGIARTRIIKFVNYNTLVTMFNLPPLTGAWKSHPLSTIFEELDQQDAKAKRPFRTALVVSKSKDMPGDGFFEALERLKGISYPTEKNSTDVELTKLSLWSAEVKAIRNYSWPDPDTT